MRQPHVDRTYPSYMPGILLAAPTVHRERKCFGSSLLRRIADVTVAWAPEPEMVGVNALFVLEGPAATMACCFLFVGFGFVERAKSIIFMCIF